MCISHFIHRMDESSEGSSMNTAMRRCGSSVDEITEKLQTIYVDDAIDHSNLVENDDSNLSKNDCCDGLNNQLPIDFNDVNHLFHMNFMQSMQLLRSQEKRFVNYVKSFYHFHVFLFRNKFVVKSF